MQHLTVTYQDIFGIWDLVKEPVTARLSRLELQWKLNADQTNATIAVDIKLRPFHEATGERASSGLLEKPVLNIFLLKCEDVDTYRNRARQLIRDWHAEVVNRKHQDWLILFVVQSDPAFGPVQRTSGTKFLGLRNSVYDKVKGDFSPKRDQCVQICLGDGRLELEDAYMDLVGKTQNAVRTSMEARIRSYEEDIQKMSDQRRESGWNFCTFFLLRESLAATYNVLSLPREALAQFDEIEKLVFDVAADRSTTHFNGQGGYAAGDDTISVIDPQAKAYHTMIMQNSISLFDFRVYLFASQCQVLTSLGLYHDILCRASAFVSSQMRILEDRRAARPGLAESWAFNAIDSVMSIIPDSAYDPAVAAAKADCNLIKRDALLSLRDGNDLDVKNERVLDVLKDSKAAIRDLTETILVDYKFAERPESSARMLLEMARFAIDDEDYTGAIKLMESAMTTTNRTAGDAANAHLPAMYMTSLYKAKQTLKYVDTCLEVLPKAREGKVYVEEMYAMVKEHHEPFSRSTGDWFDISVSFGITDSTESPDCFLEVTINSLLPAPVPVDLASLVLQDETHEWSFMSEAFEIVPGHQTVTFRSRECCSGEYRPTRLSLRYGVMTLYQEFTGASCMSVRPARLIRPAFARHIDLDEARTIPLTLHARNFALEQCSVVIQNVSAVNLGRPRQETKELEVDSRGRIQIADVPLHSYTSFELPYTSNEATFDLIVVVYFTHQGVEYTRRDTLSIDMRLPLDVNVQDFYRHDKLLSKFVISAETRLDLTEVVLHGDGYTIEPKQTTHTIDKDEPVTLLYRITPTRSHPGSMQLLMRYIKFGTGLEAALLESLNHDLSELQYGLLEDISHRIAHGASDISSFVQDPAIRSIAESLLDIATRYHVPDHSLASSLKIPVHIAPILVVTVSLIIDEALKIGNVTSATLTIHLSNVWLSNLLPVDFEFDCGTSWILLGRTRGRVKDEQSVMQLAMMPIESGQISLPSINITSTSDQTIEVNDLNMMRKVEVADQQNDVFIQL